MKAIVIGAALNGNQGAHLMLQEVTSAALKRPDNRALVLSHYPILDRVTNQNPQVEILDGRPLSVAIDLLGRSVLYKLTPEKIRDSAAFFATIRSLSGSDVALDISGISFVDGRLGALIYNFVALLPMFILGIKVVKLPQAIGPAQKFLTRTLARYALNRCHVVVARGDQTRLNLEAIGVRCPIQQAPDLGFIQAYRYDFGPSVKERSHDIAVIPSVVVRNHFDRLNGEGSYVEMVAGVVSVLSQRHKIDLIPFAWLPTTSEHNNDLLLCQEIARKADTVFSLPLGLEDLTRRVANCKVAITGRFHGMIVALGSGLPTLVTSWGHKYEEALFDLDFAIRVVDYGEMSAEILIQGVEQALSEAAVSGPLNSRLSKELGRKSLQSLVSILTEFQR